MKLTALLVFKDEAWILPAYLSSLAGAVDEIVAVDDGSTDESRLLIEAAGGHVVDGIVANQRRDGDVWTEVFPAEFALRDLLLRTGRERGGTHFICLDADEALTAPGRANIRGMLAKLKPGDKLAMRWLMLWREPDAYRDDRSVWAKLVKDFAFADDPDTELAGAARTSGPNSEDRWHKVPPECAAVLHYQFVPWWRTQAKQAWYRCFALIREPQEAYRINAMYRATLDTRAAHTTAVPPGWLEGIAVPAGIQDLPGAWHLGAILEWFDEYGIEFFEPLQIWHVPELRDAFLETVGRRPRPTLHLPPRQRAASILASAAAAVKRGHD